MKVTRRNDCRSCKGKLETIEDFGEREIISFGDKEPVKAPLELTKCEDCSLVQLRHTVDADSLFRQYFYRSGTNATMRNHLKEIVDEVESRIKVDQQDVWLDIGCNDATLLNFVGCWTVGFDPSDAIWSDPETEESDKHVLIQDFFTAKKYPLMKKAKVITQIASFYDLDDPSTFLQDVKKVLAPDGLFVIEMNYLPTMLKNNAVDNIVHEHLCYYSFSTLYSVLARNGFEISDIWFSEINGGVFRAYIRHKEHPAAMEHYLGRLVEQESEQQLDTMKPYKEFVDRVRENAFHLYSFIATEKVNNGKVTDIYGASTRGLMLLQLAGLDKKLRSGGKVMRWAVDRNPEKVGKKYSEYPIVSEETMRQNPPDYLLVLPYGFLPEFLEREKEFLLNGGKFIVPCPTPYLVGYEKI